MRGVCVCVCVFVSVKNRFAFLKRWLWLKYEQKIEDGRKSMQGDPLKGSWASLVVQWLRIRLPMQGARVRALVWEDPTCRGATGPVSRNY